MQSPPPRFWRPGPYDRDNDAVRSNKSKLWGTVFGFIPVSQHKFIKVGRMSTQGILECEFQGQYLRMSKGEAARVKKTKSSSSCNRWAKDGAGLKKA